MNSETASGLESILFYLRIRVKDNHECLRKVMDRGTVADFNANKILLPDLKKCLSDIKSAIELIEKETVIN